MKFLKHLALLFIILWISNPTFSQRNYASTVLWRISGNGLSKSSYLFGTIHLKDKKLFYFTDSVYAAIENTDGFATELTADAMSDMALDRTFSETYSKNNSKYKITESKEFKEILMKGYESEMKNKSFKELYAYFKNLRAKKNPDEMVTITDMYLCNIAKQQGKYITALEKADDQLEILQNIGIDFQELILRNAKNDKSSATILKDNYIAQNLNALNETFSDTNNRAMKWMDMNSRNEKMSEKIDSIVQTQSMVFAIGCGHLVTDSGLIVLLEKKGYTVTPVMSDNKINPENYTYTPIKNTWVLNADADSNYTILMPGKGKSIDVNEVLPMNSYVDLLSGKFYGISVYPKSDNTLAEKEKDILANYKEKRFKITNKKDVIIDNCNAIQMNAELPGTGFYNISLVEFGQNFYILLCGSEKKPQANNIENKKFIESFKLNKNKSAVVSNWVKYVDTNLGFQCMLPSMPKDKKFKNESTKTISIIDPLYACVHMIILLKSAPTKYTSNDSTHYADVVENMVLNMNLRDTTVKHKIINGFKAVELSGITEENKKPIRVDYLVVFRGALTYSFMNIFEVNNVKHDSLAKLYFNSIQFMPYPKVAWKTFVDTTYNVTIKAPSALKPNEVENLESVNDITAQIVQAAVSGNTKKELESKSALILDSTNATSFIYDFTPFTKYKYIPSDSAYWKNIEFDFTEEKDSILKREFITNDNYLQANYEVKLNGSSLTRKLNLIVTNDGLHEITGYLTNELIADKNVKELFESFKVNNTSKYTLRESKLEAVLLALKSTDSVTYADAYSEIHYGKYAKRDLEKLYAGLLQKFPEDTNNFYSVTSLIADQIIELTDSADITTNAFIKENFSKPEALEARPSMLAILANNNVPSYYQLLKEIIAKKLPLKTFPYQLNNLVNAKLTLSKNFFPDLCPLFNDTNYGSILIKLANEQVDSNINSIEIFKPYEDKIIETTLANYNKSVEDSNYYNSNFREHVAMLGKINTPKTNDCLQKLLEIKDAYYLNYVIKDLLKNKQTVAEKYIDYATQTEINTKDLYNMLKEIGAEDKIPAKKLSQEKFAKAYILNLILDESDEPYALKLTKTKEVLNADNKLERFFLFSVEYVKNGDVFPAVAGPFSMDKTIYTIPENLNPVYISDSDVYNVKGFDNYIETLKDLQNQ